MKQPTNFADLPQKYSRLEDSAVVILPVPYDGTSTWGKGADKGPQAIIEASANMELYDIETDSQVYLKGIFTDKLLQPSTLPEDVVEKVAEKVSSHIEKNRFTVVIGGEHSVLSLIHI